MIKTIDVLILDSSKVTFSLSTNLLAFKYTIPIVFADGLDTTLAIALLDCPIIFSPMIAFVSTLAIELKFKVSNTGSEVFKDSYTAITFTTSGYFRQISSS